MKILVIAGPNKTKGKKAEENREALRTALSRIGFSVAGLFRDKGSETCTIDLRNNTGDDEAIRSVLRGYQQRDKKADTKMVMQIDPNKLMFPEEYIGAIVIGEIDEEMASYLGDVFPSRNRKGKILCLTGYNNGDNAPLVVPEGYDYHIVPETTPMASHAAIRKVFEPTPESITAA